MVVTGSYTMNDAAAVPDLHVGAMFGKQMGSKDQAS